MLIQSINVADVFLKRNLEELHPPDEIILGPDETIIGPPLADLTLDQAPLYERWELYPIQYEWMTVGTISATHAIIECSYDGVTENYRARHSRIAYKLVDEGAWHTVTTSVDETKRTITGRVPLNAERISFAYNTAWYSKFTQQLANEYPVWTHARNSKKSNAQQFLNFFGIALEEVESWIEWTRRQKYIETADLKQIDYAFVYSIPDEVNLAEAFTVRENLNNTEVPVIGSIHDLMKNVTFPGYFLDKETRQLFTRINYGVIRIEQENFMDWLDPSMHHVWNTFDEFALLFDLRRLPNETNESLKERILDVFRYPAGAHYLGLIYGITRETNNMRRLVWKDDTKPFYIKANNRRILAETLHIDHKHIDTYERDYEDPESYVYHVYDNGDIEIAPMKTGRSHVITLVADLFLFQLYDKDNDEVYPILFEDNGQATEKLHYWVNQINQIAPSMWGYTRWDIHYWDNVDQQGTGLGFIPNQYDSELDAWK